MAGRTLIPDPDDYKDLDPSDAALIERKNQRDLRETGEREIANTPGGTDPFPQPEIMAGDSSGTGFGKARKMALDAILAAQYPKQEMADDTDTKGKTPEPYSADFRPIAEMNIAETPGGIDLAPSRSLIPPSKREAINSATAWTFPPMDVTAGPPKVSVSRPGAAPVAQEFVARSAGRQQPAPETGGTQGNLLKTLQGIVRPEVAQYLAAKQGDDGELADAQRNAALMSGLSQIGKGISGLAGFGRSSVRPDGAPFDALAAQGQQGVANVMQQRQEQDRRAKASLDGMKAQIEAHKMADDEALSDPNSPETARARDFAKKVFAGVGKSNPSALAAFDGMTGAEIGKAFPVVQKLLDDEANRGEKGREFDLRDKELEERRREAWMQHQDNMQFKRDAATEKADEKREQQTNKDTQSLEKRLGPDASDFAQNYADAAAIVNKYGKGNLPGIGTVRGHLPSFMVSDDGIKLRQALGKMAASFRHEMTGAAASNAERAELAKISGLADNGTDEEVLQGLQSMKRLHDAHLARTYAGFSPQVSQTYQQRNPQLTPGALPNVGGRQPVSETLSKDRTKKRINYSDGTFEVVPNA